jgi:hypothetical protein
MFAVEPDLALRPDALDGATGGQYCRHDAEHVEWPGLSAVSMYTVIPSPSTTTLPREVDATCSPLDPETGFVDGLLCVVSVAVPVAVELEPDPHAVKVSRETAATAARL